MAENTEADGVFGLAELLVLMAVEDPRLIPSYREADQKAKSLEHSGWKRTTGMTQNQRILKHLRKSGSITVREAIVDLHVSSLTKRVHELREAGHEIVSVVKHHPVTGQKYTRYYLKEGAPA